MTGCSFNEEAARYVFGALEVNKSIKYLDLRSVELESPVEEVSYLSKALQVNTTLTELESDLNNHRINKYLNRNYLLASMMLPDELETFFVDETLSDVTLQTSSDPEATIKAHKIVLASRSRCVTLLQSTLIPILISPCLISTKIPMHCIVSSVHFW